MEPYKAAIALEFKEKIDGIGHITLKELQRAAGMLREYPTREAASIKNKAEAEQRPLSKDESAKIERLEAHYSKLRDVEPFHTTLVDYFVGEQLQVSSPRLISSKDGLEHLLDPYEFRCYSGENAHMLATLGQDIELGGTYLLLDHGTLSKDSLFSQLVLVEDRFGEYGLFVDALQKGEKKQTPEDWFRQGHIESFSSALLSGVSLAQRLGVGYVAFGEFSVQAFSRLVGMRKERVFPRGQDVPRKLGYPSTAPEQDPIPQGLVYTNSLFRSNQTQFPVLRF